MESQGASVLEADVQGPWLDFAAQTQKRVGWWDAGVCEGHSHIGRVYVSLDSSCWNHEYHYLILTFVVKHLPHRAVGKNQAGAAVKHFVSIYN